MADDLGIASGIIAVLQLSQEVIQYLLEVKDVNADRNHLLTEIGSLSGFLYILRERAENPGAQSDGALFNTLRVLNTTKGPLDQFKAALERSDETQTAKRCEEALQSARLAV